MQGTPRPELQPLNALVGEWTTKATHPAYPDTIVHGRAVFEWLEGEQFLIQRSQAEHPDFPNAIGIIGAPTEGLSMHYFDSRGVHRLYEVSFEDGIWRFWRDAPGFSQRFTGTFDDDGNTISGRSQLSRDGSSCCVLWAVSPTRPCVRSTSLRSRSRAERALLDEAPRSQLISSGSRPSRPRTAAGRSTSRATAAAALEWRGYATVRALSVLRGNDMIDAPAPHRDANR